MLTLILIKITPINNGNRKIAKKLFLNLFQIFKNIIDIPKLNTTENKYEYPIKCTDEDCCKIKELHKIKKIIGDIIDLKKVSLFSWFSTARIEIIDRINKLMCDNKQL